MGPDQTEVPAALDGYERYVLTTDAEVPQGTPEQKSPAKFCRAGEVVRVHKDFGASRTWRLFDASKPFGPGLDLPSRARVLAPDAPKAGA